MINYIIRRILYSVPIVTGVILIAYLLFFGFNTPENLARSYLGKNPTETQVKNWVRRHGLEGSRFTVLSRLYKNLLTFNFGNSFKDDEKISDKIFRGMGPSLSLAVPSFIFSIIMTLSIALIIAYYRESYLDITVFFISIVLMSVSSITYIIVIQKVIGQFLLFLPIYGYSRGLLSFRFIILPLTISIIASLGGGIRFYRTVFLDESGKDYIRTAKAKGLKENIILFKHVLKNAMIPILTTVVMQIPFLFTGSLVLESYFGIPGLGRMTLNAIFHGDFSIIMAMVYIGSLLYITGIILTDISYTFVDPRVTFKSDRNIWIVYLCSFILPVIAVPLLQLKDRLFDLKFVKTIELSSIFNTASFQNTVCFIIFILVIFIVRLLLKSEYWKDKWKIYKKNKSSAAALIIVLTLFIIGYLDSIIIPVKTESGIIKNKTVIDLIFEKPLHEKTYSAPFSEYLFNTRKPEKLKYFHILGTDILGRDVLLRLIKGTRTAILIGGVTAFIVIPLSILFGLTAGYYGGRIDDIIQYIYTTIASVPTILLLISLMSAFGRGIFQLSFALGICGWVGLARLIRGETIKHKSMEYVLAAKSIGLSDIKIMYRHILPNVSHLIIIRFVLLFGGLILSEVILSYLGLGVKPGQGSWGDMISGAQNELIREPVIWWIFTFSSLILFIFVFCLNIVGDRLRDALDPNLRN